MKIQTVVALSAISLAAGSAQAGGIDRSDLPLNVIFKQGNYAQLGFANANPSISGQFDNPQQDGNNTGDMGPGFNTSTLAYKHAIDEKVSVAAMYYQPYGAEAKYGNSSAYAGTQTELSTQALAVVGKYQFNDNISAYGGMRFIEADANIVLPFLEYTSESDTTHTSGWLAGVAYEIPDIMLRAAFTYEAEINYSGTGHEEFKDLNYPGFGVINPAATASSKSDVTLPQTVTLDLQSAVSDNVLLFAKLKWSEWSKFSISPTLYSNTIILGTTEPLGPVVEFSDDTLDQTYGAAYKVNDQLSVIARYKYSAKKGNATILAPYDGKSGYGLAALYNHGSFNIGLGAEYLQLGSSDVNTNTRGNLSFDDSEAVVLATSLGYQF